MPCICAIFTHYANASNTLTCLHRLAGQTRQPDHILLVNNSSADDPALDALRAWGSEHHPHPSLHILQMPGNLGSAGGCARGIRYAFEHLGADYAWMLHDDAWPRSTALERLLAAAIPEQTVRVSLVIDPSRQDELSHPLCIASPHSGAPHPWLYVLSRQELPHAPLIPSRGGWLGALYPKKAWQIAGAPTEALFLGGEAEEYPWKLRQAGFSFVTVADSELEHPSCPRELIHYHLADDSYFYKPQLPLSRLYYDLRNWAWLQRLKRPAAPLARLAACGLYILFNLNAMLRADELTPRRVYTLFRALHNGFHGKLRPY